MVQAAIFYSFIAQRRLGRERIFYQGGDGWSKGKRGEGVGAIVITSSHLSLPPPPIFYSNSKSNMAGYIDLALQGSLHNLLFSKGHKNAAENEKKKQSHEQHWTYMLN